MQYTAQHSTVQYSEIQYSENTVHSTVPSEKHISIQRLQHALQLWAEAEWNQLRGRQHRGAHSEADAEVDDHHAARLHVHQQVVQVPVADSQHVAEYAVDRERLGKLGAQGDEGLRDRVDKAYGYNRRHIM